MKKQKCADCYYLRRDKQYKQQLYCCRFPPTVLESGDYYPTVRNDDWCGEWKEKDFIQKTVEKRNEKKERTERH